MEFCKSEIIVFVIPSNFPHDSETLILKHDSETFIMILSFFILVNFTPNLMQFILIYISFTYSSKWYRLAENILTFNLHWESNETLWKKVLNFPAWQPMHHQWSM